MRRPFRFAAEQSLGLYNDMTGEEQDTMEWLGWIAEGGWYGNEPDALTPMPDLWQDAPVGGEFTSSLSMEDMLEQNLPRTLHLLEMSHMSFLGPKTAQVKALLDLMGEASIEENFIGTRWSKLLINASFSGMSAVLGTTFGEAAGNKSSRKIVQAIIKECIDVCSKAGIRIEPVQGKDIVKLLDYGNPVKKALSFMIIPIAIRKHALLKASMLQDLENGKLTEVDSINGSVCAYGRKVGVPTPMNDAVVEVIHKCESGELKPGYDNLKYFSK